MKALIIVLAVWFMMYLIPVMLYVYGVMELKKKRKMKREEKAYRYEKPSFKKPPALEVNETLVSVSS